MRLFCTISIAGSLLLLLSSCSQVPSDGGERSLEQGREWLKGIEGDWRNDTDQAKQLPAPPSSRSVAPDALRIDLAEPDLNVLGQNPLADVMVARRSRREYTETPLRLDELGFMLWSAQGLSGADYGDDGALQTLYRTVPSAGGRFPLETSVYVHRVEGLAQGLYLYQSAKHQLVLLQKGDMQASLQRACYGAEAVAQAAAVFLWTAVPYRTEWKYGSIAHRMIAMEAGHACQNLYLAAESLQAGACAMSAYDQHELDKLLGVDGTDEFVIYLATAGKVE